ncbi:MAG: NAD(P)-binding domain-containing protein, partial [Runella zeae]
MRISFVGAGNVAWHMAQALEHAGHHIVEVYSRDSRNARRLVNKLNDTHIA